MTKTSNKDIMTLSPISEEKISNALRSVFRYIEMAKSNVPDILIESESEILKKRFNNMDAYEIVALITLWPEYLTQQVIMDEVANKEFEQHLLSLN